MAAEQGIKEDWPDAEESRSGPRLQTAIVFLAGCAKVRPMRAHRLAPKRSQANGDAAPISVNPHSMISRKELGIEAGVTAS